jgi:hypothetical protein
VLGFPRLILADQKRRGLPSRHPDGELLDEVLQIDISVSHGRGGLSDRPKGIDEYKGRARGLHFLNDPREDLLQRSSDQILAQVDEADRPVHPIQIEELVLLLVAQHLQRWLADNGEVDGVGLRTGQPEHDVLRQRGLARAGCAGNEIEGELRQAPAQNLVESGYVSAELSNRNLVGHASVPSDVSAKPSGHAFRR